MLQLTENTSTRNGRWTRREWLRIGAAGLGAGLANVSRASEPALRGPGFGKAKSVVLIFASGGQSHIDMWDPKPDAPAEVRGVFGTIPTSVPGLFFGEHMPRLAKLADRMTVVRSMSHEDLDHGSAAYLSLTGHYHTRRSSNPPPQPTDYPCHSAILKRVRPSSAFVEPAVHVNGPAIIAPNNIAPGQFGGFLGREFDPLTVGDVTHETAVVPGLAPQLDLPLSRLSRRQSLVETLDGTRRQWERNSEASDLAGLYDQAQRMLAEPKTRLAFDLSREPVELRERYGHNRSGQACLLARRLVEAEVPLITVIWNHHSRGQDMHPDTTEFYGWDTHNDIFDALENRLLPRFDQSLSALLEDLEKRGLLDETLVLCFGEFGRAPLVALEPRFAGASPGRKHWAACYSVMAAGAGVARGGVLGASDKLGAYPKSQSYGPWDLTATIFAALGIDPAAHYTDPTGRPYKIAEGTPIHGLYA